MPVTEKTYTQLKQRVDALTDLVEDMNARMISLTAKLTELKAFADKLRPTVVAGPFRPGQDGKVYPVPEHTGGLSRVKAFGVYKYRVGLDRALEAARGNWRLPSSVEAEALLNLAAEQGYPTFSKGDGIWTGECTQTGLRVVVDTEEGCHVVDPWKNIRTVVLVSESEL